MPASGSAGGGGGGGLCAALSFPPPPSPPLPFAASSPHSSSAPSPGPSGLILLRKSQGLATMWAAPRHVVNYPGHNGPACSSGVPLPPNGEGAPPPTPVSPYPYSPSPPSPPLFLVLGGVLRRSRGFPPISWFSPRTKGVRACLGGDPPSPSGWGPAPFSSSPLCTPCAGDAHFSGGPLGTLVGFWGPPSVHAVRWERTLLGGCPLLGILSPGAPLLPLGHSVRWYHTLPYGGVPSFLCA